MNLTRRSTIKALGISATTLAIPSFAAGNMVGGNKPVKVGIISDVHIGFSPNAEKRLEAFVRTVKDESLDAILQLGDFAFPNAKHQSAPDLFNAAHDHSLHVIGNHDLDHRLTKKDCLKAWGMPSPYYRRDLGGLRLLVLDGNDRGSPTHKGGYPAFIGRQQVEWLSKELDSSDRPVLVVSHQPLAGPLEIDNAKEIQKLLAGYREKILICINGHTHRDLLLQQNEIRFLHINSASYFWMGGKVRMAHYRDPLFTVMTVDPVKRQITVKGNQSAWVGKGPDEAEYFKNNKERERLRDSVTPQIRARTIG